MLKGEKGYMSVCVCVCVPSLHSITAACQSDSGTTQGEKREPINCATEENLKMVKQQQQKKTTTHVTQKSQAEYDCSAC